MSEWSDHFAVHELVPPEMYSIYGDEAIRYIDPRLLDCLAVVRDHVDCPMTINNYGFGGDRTESGLRVPGMKYWSLGSAHSYGMALDALCRRPASEIRNDILNGIVGLPHPVRIENNVNWLHLDVMNISKTKRVQVFSP